MAVKTGTNNNDTLSGTSSRDTITGAAGNDVLSGLGGDDTILGGTGKDTIDGRDANDTIFGGDHQDTIFGVWGNDTIHGGAGNDTLDGGTGNDRMFGDGADPLSNYATYTSPGHDVMTGGSGNDWMWGDNGGINATSRTATGTSASAWTSNGITLTALDLTGQPASVAYDSNGVGVVGSAPVTNQINHNVNGQSETLVVNFGGQNVTTATITVSNLIPDENGGEQGKWTAYDAGGTTSARVRLDPRSSPAETASVPSRSPPTARSRSSSSPRCPM
ncbi:MAG: calcium-binding protein [Alphaproteobacteria bacterium]|nr:calcium-binding protein [Alphaproteobacteria bacterium]